jgi:hypothetical protein
LEEGEQIVTGNYRALTRLLEHESAVTIQEREDRPSRDTSED